MNKTIKTGIIVIASAAAVVFAAGQIRLYAARKAAGDFADKTGITINYPVSETIESKKALVTEIWQLAVFEVTTRTDLNTAFDHTDKEYFSTEPVKKNGFEKKEELSAFAMEEAWRKRRLQLDKEIKSKIDLIYKRAGDDYGLKKDEVTGSYIKKQFYNVTMVMQFVADKEGAKAYKWAAVQKYEYWNALPMDMAYVLEPELIKAGAEEVLQEAAKSSDLTEVRQTVKAAEAFEERYNVSLDNLKRARKKQEALEYIRKPDVPTVGMSLWDAYETKLGRPTRKTSETKAWAQKNHTYGKLYWEKNGRQIFSAHYYDGTIERVWDTRNMPAWTPPNTSNYSSGRNDHDFEAYYEDNRDEYDDYDEAYEGFWDDEGAWDDY